MEWFICILLLAVGIVLIVKGGDWFVDASSWIAEVSGVPRFIIGATIVSIATTLPEILVSTIGAGEGNIGLAIGNAIGSVNANIGLILGVSILSVPAIIDRKKNYKKILILILAILIPLFATLGDFVFSSIKRYWGIKDYGKLIPGHGGVLDRLDSIFFASIISAIFVFMLASITAGELDWAKLLV